MKKTSSPYASFSDPYVERRTRRAKFFKDIDRIMDWRQLERQLDKHYSRGDNAVGQKAYSGLLLFKMLLAGIWYGLSDESTEEMANENLSVMLFCGLRLEDEVPDHSTLSCFRTELSKRGAFDRLLNEFNAQLCRRGIMVKEGKAKVDATLTDTPRKPKGSQTYGIAEDRKEDEREARSKEDEDRAHRVMEVHHRGVDAQARWLKKRGKLHYGYKQHIAVDEDGLVQGVHTTPANEHDSKGLLPVLSKVCPPKKKEVWADKGYRVPDNIEYLKAKKIKDRIQQKAYRNRPLTYWQKRRNVLISKQRYIVERAFGRMKKWFGAGFFRYVGIEKTHAF